MKSLAWFIIGAAFGEVVLLWKVHAMYLAIIALLVLGTRYTGC